MLINLKEERKGFVGSKERRKFMNLQGKGSILKSFISSSSDRVQFIRYKVLCNSIDSFLFMRLAFSEEQDARFDHFKSF